jgi:type IV pilus assembly protein PilB
MVRATRQVDDPKPPAEGPHEQVEFAELWRPSEGASVLRGPERILLERGLVKPEHLEQAVKRQAENPRLSVLQVLVQSKAIDEVVALQAVAAYFKLPFKRIAASEVNPDVMALLPVEFLKAKQILPICKTPQGIVVGMSDPADIFLIDDLKRRLRSPIRLVIVPPTDILKAIDDLSTSPAQQVDEIIKDITEDAVEVVDKKAEEVTDLEKIAGESPVIRYVNYLISSATK